MSTLIIALLVTVVLGHPATEEKTTTTVTIKATVESTKVTQELGRPPITARSDRNPTVKCEHIHPTVGEASPRNHVACESHCRTLAEVYTAGSCSEGGICICERSLRRGEASPGVDEPHPTVRCVDLIPDEGEERRENDLVCRLHCTSLGNGYRNGECSGGMCFCSSQL
ncbi:UNVERIFIED_CONTAM: hypothetical protein PYX00_002000 [Menopon gallinae]|uniref:Invertebrate defensins family profile domain-containing protein n=1 Tax=Menopon gallinae TaxID=328185 RepID=A0AAW2IGQ3_9NEOP